MIQNDLRTLRQLLREVVRTLRRSNRELEDLLGIGHGNLGRLLDGTIELRVRHLLAFAELLEVAPAELLELGCPETTAAATRRLSDWIAWGPQAQDPHAAEHKARPGSLEELRELLRADIRREVAKHSRRRRSAEPGEEPPGSE